MKRKNLKPHTPPRQNLSRATARERKRGAPQHNANARAHGLYANALTTDEGNFLAALAGREDLVEEIALLRLALFRAERNYADLAVLATGAEALARLVNVQQKIVSGGVREFEQLLGKALDVIGERFGMDL